MINVCETSLTPSKCSIPGRISPAAAQLPLPSESLVGSTQQALSCCYQHLLRKQSAVVLAFLGKKCSD